MSLTLNLIQSYNMKKKNYEMPSVEEVLVTVEQGFAASQVEKPKDDENEY